MGSNHGPLIVVIAVILTGAGGAYVWKSKQPPKIELDDCIAGKEVECYQQWARAGIKYDEFNIGFTKDAVTKKESYQYQPLFFAAMSNEEEAVKTFLDHGANPNALDWKGHTALMAACQNLNAASVKYLLDKKAEVNAVAKDGQSALVMAIIAGREYLTNQKNKQGRTLVKPEDTANFATHLSNRPTIVKMLLDAGADPNIGTKGGIPAIFHASDDASVFKMIADKGVKLDSIDNQGHTLLFVCQDKDMASKILAAGVNVNARSKDGATALMWGTDPDVAALLLAHGADINAKDAGGRTALHYLAEGLGGEAKFQLLVDKGAKLDIPDAHGTTPMMASVINLHPTVTDILVKKGVKLYIMPKAPAGRGGGGGEQ